MRKFKTLLLTWAAGAFAWAQVPPESAIGHSNFSNFTGTRPFQVGSVLPGICSVGQMFFETSAPSGQNVFACTAANVWSMIGGGSGGGSVSAGGVGAALLVSDSGTANAYKGCPNPNTTLSDGVILVLRALATNTGASTISICNGTPVPIVHANGSSLSAGEIIGATSANPAQAILLYHAASNRFELANQPYPILPVQSLVSKNATPVTNGAAFTYMHAMLNPGEGRRTAMWLANGSGIDQMGAAFTSTSSGGSSAAVAPAGSDPVMWSTTTGATSGNSAAHATGSGGTNNFIFRTGRNLAFNWNGKFGSVSSARLYVCMTSFPAASLAATDSPQTAGAAICFQYSTSAGQSTWNCYVSNGSASSTMDSGVAPDTNPHEFGVIVDDAGGTLHFYIDTVEVCTNFPTANLPAGTNLSFSATATTLAAQQNSVATAHLFVGSDQ
ncbi:MAG TPA: hypothetical protein VKX39_04445 [Bryobacteraceae bacterium]|jgi:hypothetical protein|nr:hypothetical protein [Bryobacteraceae bacterium]